ncbi:MAG: exodeoxyribonuclease VII small subunit [Phycisphaerae bacterium]|nr:exodeoxyribonuclease VII small subunit [Phycisphaerae bacterium]
MDKENEEKLSFEQALTNLETIVAEVERGDVPLEKSLAKYARGMELIKHCRAILDQAEKQIETISKAENQEA